MRIHPPAAALLLLISLPCAGPAAAQSAAAPAAAGATVHMSYTGTALGMDVMKLRAAVSMDGAGYRIATAFNTTGLLSVFVRGEQHSTVWGAWRGGQPAPQRFWSWGYLRGTPRETLIDYDKGRPVVRTLTPPVAGEREEVPEQARGDTIDTLSAIAFLVRRVADTGACDGGARVFDGRRLTQISARTVGQVVPGGGEAGTYAGETLRCDFTGRELAGFMLDDSSWQHRPHDGTAWLGRAVRGGPPVPVRLRFDTRWVGEVTLVLTDAGPGPLPETTR
jgi:hypothetical protein